MLILIGEKYKIGKKNYAKYQCDCGQIIELPCYHRRKSCGCKEHKQSKFQGIFKTKHPLYHSFKQMKYRKNGRDPNFTLDDLFELAEKQNYSIGMLVCTIDSNLPYSKTNIVFTKNKPKPKQNIQQTLETHFKKYGKYFTGTEEYQKKRKITSIKRYGTEHPVQSQIIKDKIKNTILNKKLENPNYQLQINEKTKQSNLNKYGVEYVSNVPYIRYKQINGLITKYGKIFNRTNNTEQNQFGLFLKLFSNFKPDYSILNGQEIDFLSKELNVGFEYCGLYWHTDKSKEPRNKLYHYNKYKECLNNNIRLFTIWSSEWKNRKIQIQNYIKSALGFNEIKYQARKCEIKPLEGKIGKEFVAQYHIQGQNRIGKFYSGCYYNQELIGCISLNTHHRNSKEIVLDRMVFKSNTTIAGGASRMFKLCVEWAKLNGYKQIISWSDNRWSQGNVYIQLGFRLDKELAPDYAYVDLKNPKEIISKQSMKGKNCTNLAKIWDCGKKRWIIYL